ncbi:Man1-Src1p-C-terminal domain-containing protein [Crepidotus variabilis]|uniref:Man1-Src1p-C-terminal domain-containing protein n=1 Tax=Crepidotus variabilis TaxID=179855 RepID=A0A9P6ENB7_9AGAR|nr:Man1-Src1p-C-terminal domain-containing protein [Crepidotus variabilis]
MSKLTAAQIIGLGEYLDPDFEPAKLTVSQLLGVLGFHNVRYPTPYTKGKLVQVFNDEIKTRSSKLKKERLKAESSLASDDGITDGVTGQPLNGKDRTSLARRSSRRLSSNTSRTDDSSPPRPEPPKRRRSSAQPALGGTSRRTAVVPTEVTLVEESEPEEDELPVKKVGRPKKTSTAGKQARRKSHLSGDESGWDDNNIFQSGAESSSPVRPSPARPRVSRTSGVFKKSRKSMSAPPQMEDSPTRPTPQSMISPPQSPFKPALPPFPEFKVPPASRSRITPAPDFNPVEHPKQEEQDVSVHIEETIAEETEPPSQETPDIVEKEEEEVDSELAPDTAALVQQDPSAQQLSPVSEASRPSTAQISARVLVWFLILASTYATWSYKAESSSIGFCDRGSNSNQALDGILERRAIGDVCDAERRRQLLEQVHHNISSEGMTSSDEACPLPPLIPLPEPSSCTPCPTHATCAQHGVLCDTGYLLRPHILLSFIPVEPSQSALTTKYVPQISGAFFSAISAATDGLPTFGSVGLPPRCVEDPQRKRHIGNLGKAIESRLAKERGRRICRGDQVDPSEPEDSLEQAVKWGVEVGTLKEDFRKTANPALLPSFDDMFTEAIQQLTQWGGVFVGETSDGTRYVAHKTPSMSLDCIVVVKSRETWAAWRATVLASIFALLTAMGGRIRMTQRQKENRRIAGLVQVALDTLRNQEFAHYTDPINAPEPYLSSIQLRDVVLQDEHSVNARKRLWEKVERVVEGNANVRANLEEIEGGDETRVWRWVGNSGRTPGRKEFELES